VEVEVSVGESVAGVEECLGVLEAVLTGAAMTAVAWSGFGDFVIDGIAEGVKVNSIMVIGSGVESLICLMTQFPKLV